MKEMLLALKKAVDEALAADLSTEEIPLAAFPSHVVKSLELILGDADVERAARQLAMLQTELDEACALVKQGDNEQLIRVAVYEEPELTAKPRVEKELPVPYDSGTAGYKPAKAAANSELKPMLAKLVREVAALKEALGPGDAEQHKAANDQAETDKAKAKDKAKPAPATRCRASPSRARSTRRTTSRTKPSPPRRALPMAPRPCQPSGPTGPTT